MLVMKSGEKPNLENYSVFFETLIMLMQYLKFTTRMDNRLQYCWIILLKVVKSTGLSLRQLKLILEFTSTN